MSTALLLIDIQRDYFDDGRWPLDGAAAAAQQARRLLGAFRDCALPVFHIQHVALRPDAPFFVAGTVGAELHPDVAPRTDEPILRKSFPNSFRQTDLLARLERAGIDALIVAGMMTHQCVQASARAAFDLGFECTVAHDACATRALSFDGRTVAAADVHAAALAGLAGTIASLRSTETLLAQIARLRQGIRGLRATPVPGGEHGAADRKVIAMCG